MDRKNTVTIYFFCSVNYKILLLFDLLQERVFLLKRPLCILLYPTFTPNIVRGSVGGTKGFKCIMDCQNDETLASSVYKPLH